MLLEHLIEDVDRVELRSIFCCSAPAVTRRATPGLQSGAAAAIMPGRTGRMSVLDSPAAKRRWIRRTRSTASGS